MTSSIKRAIKEVDRRRKLQEEYNKKHNIKPQTITKDIESFLDLENKEAEL